MSKKNQYAMMYAAGLKPGTPPTLFFFITLKPRVE